MALTKILPADVSGKGVVGLADTPGLSTADMQDKFDELVLDVVVPKHNAMVDELAGTGGAAEIGTADGSNVEAALAARAKDDDVLAKTNETPFVPAADYQPATKKYVDDAVFASGAADMLKAVYDTNNNGIVDESENAQKLGGQLPSYYGKAPLHLTATLTAAGWAGSAAPYTRTLSLAGVLASDHPHIAPVYSETIATAIAQKEAWAAVSEADTGAGKITFTCFEDKPTVDIPILVEVLR